MCNLCCTVDVTDAGEGDMVISISSLAANEGGSQNIPNQVTTSAERGINDGAIGNGMGSRTRTKFDVSYTPLWNGLHHANILFNSQHVEGVLMQCYGLK